MVDELYKRRWQIEIFLGTSENACKSLVFITIIMYLTGADSTQYQWSLPLFCHENPCVLDPIYHQKHIANEIQITVQKEKRNQKTPDKGQKVLKFGSFYFGNDTNNVQLKTMKELYLII